MPELKGENIYLEIVKPQDIALVRSWSIKTRDSFFLNNSTLMISTDDLSLFISSLNHKFYLIYDRAERPLGVLLFSNIHNPRRTAEVALTMQPSRNNTKLLREALETALTHLFKKTNLEKFYCHCLTHEEELKKVLLDCYFKKEGQFREHLFYHNKFHDQEVWSLRKEDYYQ
ncbi:acetyltransferase GNAT family [Candidatus Termititenax persephonae]|uniref:Acetyltransferase GNAT family n=1 Tax=Candidatus Termititenax persephonae TaxID=2218525 RepID=A0A388THF2_9BACT|nr:acetyltransferase GNAT family [Candidatus Termititenax persephonae]